MLFRLRFPFAQKLDGEFWIMRIYRPAMQLAHPNPIFRRAALVLTHAGIVAGSAGRGGADVGRFAQHDLALAVRRRPDRRATALRVRATPSGALRDLEL